MAPFTYADGSTGNIDTNGGSGAANVDYLRITPAPAPGVDLLIRNRKEPTFGGDNVYATNGAVQQRSISTSFFPANYEMRIENDGAAPDSFILKSNFVPAPGWRVSYYLVYPDGSKPDPIPLGDGWNTITWLRVCP